MKKHDLATLKAKALPVLNLSDLKLRKQFIEIARNEKKSGTEAFNKALVLANERFKGRKKRIRNLALGTRSLAIIRRDYGEEVFEETENPQLRPR